MDIKRIAAMVAECDDDDELIEVLAEVYKKMFSPGQQAAFNTAKQTVTVRVVVQGPEAPMKVIEARPGTIEVVPVGGGLREKLGGER